MRYMYMHLAFEADAGEQSHMLGQLQQQERRQEVERLRVESRAACRYWCRYSYSCAATVCSYCVQLLRVAELCVVTVTVVACV